MGSLGKYDDSQQGMTKEEQKRLDATNDLFDDPGVSLFVCALISTFFSDEFNSELAARNWSNVIFYLVGIWVIFAVCRAFVVAAFNMTIAEKQWFDKLGKWKGTVAAAFSMIFYIAARLVWSSITK